MYLKKKISINNVKFGRNCEIVEPVNIYGAKLGNKVFVGPFVEIQKNTSIGNNTRVQSHSFICEKVKIGNNCFIGHGVKFINDKFKKNKILNNPKNFLISKELIEKIKLTNKADIDLKEHIELEFNNILND